MGPGDFKKVALHLPVAQGGRGAVESPHNSQGSRQEAALLGLVVGGWSAGRPHHEFLHLSWQLALELKCESPDHGVKERGLLTDGQEPEGSLFSTWVHQWPWSRRRGPCVRPAFGKLSPKGPGARPAMPPPLTCTIMTVLLPLPRESCNR